MAQTDPNQFAGHLTSFMHRLESTVTDWNIASWQLRYPAGRPTVVGSDFGRQTWDSAEGSKILQFLLTDETLSAWFTQPSGSEPVELQFILASVVDEWRASTQSPGEYATQFASTILENMREQHPTCRGIALTHGLNVERYAELPVGLAVAPFAIRQLTGSAGMLPLSQIDLMRLPRQPTMLLMASIGADRSELSSSAAITAFGMARIYLERLATAIWLSCGTNPARGDVFVWHDSPYPAVAAERFAPLPERKFTGDLEDIPPRQIDVVFLRQVIQRLSVIWGEHGSVVDQEAELTLWTALSYIQASLDSHDDVMTVLLAYSALEGMLLKKETDDSRLGPRIASLIGTSDENSRTIRKFVSDFRELRGNVAHGRRPLASSVSNVLGQAITDAELAANLPRLDYQLGMQLRRKCMDLLRRVFLAVLWLMIEVESSSLSPIPLVPRPGLTRVEVQDTLEDACRNVSSANALLAQRIPDVIRLDA